MCSRCGKNDDDGAGDKVQGACQSGGKIIERVGKMTRLENMPMVAVVVEKEKGKVVQTS